MALKEKYMLKTVIGATDLSIEAKAGESLLVKNIRVVNPVGDYATVNIEKSTVGFFRTAGRFGNHLPFMQGMMKHSHDWTTSSSAGADETLFYGLENAGNVEIAARMIGNLAVDTTYRRVGSLEVSGKGNQNTILDFLSEQGLFAGYPIQEGETLTITGVNQATSIQMIEYEKYDAGDIVNTMPNGSKSMEYLFLHYGSSGANIATAGSTLFDTSHNPVEFPRFPYGFDVPSKRQIELYGICGSDFAPKENTGANYLETAFLKLVKDRLTLFDEDKQGLLMLGRGGVNFGDVDAIAEGTGIIGNYSELDSKPPFMFPEPLVFVSGEELNISLTTIGGGAFQIIDTLEQEIALIEKVTVLP